MAPTDNPDWYDLRHLPPRGMVRVRVRWPGYQVVAASDVDKRGIRHWHEVKGRELVPLTVEPRAWQPEDGTRWQWPNGRAPEPLPVEVIPQMAAGASFEFREVSEAEAAEMAREMEENRRVAAGADGMAPGANPHKQAGAIQWWRDVASIKYEPMGSVSRWHGEARIMRALIVERSIRMDLKRSRTNAAVLVDLKLTLADILAEHPGEDWVPPLAAMPEDWRDFEIVMGWLAEVMPSRTEIRVLRGRMVSPPQTWEMIGYDISRSGERARQIYEATIEGLIATANVKPRRARARLRELQARNREAKRA